ncbi:hypothetical protein PLICRDRAFT_37553 [Plicaturopsis crispa FD-325 SS-3]|nr:hypothetical protein PLICRDRAFT_37553 [Plicaturopsis crispa FD-325 SS-3]
MASFNVTAEDCTPLITYAPTGAWTDDPSNDTLITSYSDNSLHTTSAQGATATIQFNGTGLWLYGGLRPNYGTYTLTVDGKTVKSGNANSAQPSFKQLLGAASGLSNGPHTAVLTNTGSGSGIDIDSLIFENQIGSPGDSVSTTTIDDSDSRMVYSPSTDWHTNNQQQFMNGTLHFSATAGSQVSTLFEGEAVAVYGTVSPDHADIKLTIDGNIHTMNGGANGEASVLHPKTLLYYANNLGAGQHNLTLANDPQSGTGQFIDVDAVTVYSASGKSAGNNSSASPSNENTKAATGSSSKSLIGPVVGGLVGFLIILALLFFVFLRRRRGTAKRRSTMRSPITPALPIQDMSAVEAGFGSGAGIFYNEKLSPYNVPSYTLSDASHDSRRDSGESFHSYHSYRSTEDMISRSSSMKSLNRSPLPPRPSLDTPILRMPLPPPPTVARGPNRTGADAAPPPYSRPLRPNRPASLQLQDP